MKNLLVIMPWDDAASLVAWAARFARATGDGLTVVCHGKKKAIDATKLLPVPPKPEESPTVKKVRAAMAEIKGLDVELQEIKHADPVHAIVRIVEHNAVETLIIGSNVLASERSERWRFTDRLYRFAPCGTLVIDVGQSDPCRCNTILVPVTGRQRVEAIQFTLKVAETEDAVIQPLLVGSYIGADSENVAMRELELELSNADVETGDRVQPVVEVSAKPIEAIVRRGNSCDLVFMAHAEIATLQRIRGVGSDSVADPLRPETAIVAYRPPRVNVGNVFSQMAQALINWTPTLDAEERVDVFDRLQEGARLSFDFCTMLALSAAIASLGLMQDSASIVIGAMLVAPLMTPLIGCGLALIQGNVRLYGRSTKAAVVGIIAALGLSFLIGLATREFEITTELSARGTPNILDLAIAYLSGMAAAYAMSRPKLIGTIVGVAIATALVPPLATVGISMAHGEWQLTLGSAQLFLTNVVAIILGVATVFYLLGMRKKVGLYAQARWPRHVLILLFLGFVALTIPLSSNLMDRLSEGEDRPLVLPASEAIRQKLHSRVAEEPGVTLYMIARPGFDPDLMVRVTLISPKPISKDLQQDIIRTIREEMDEEVIVQIAVVDAMMLEDKPATTSP